MAEECPRYAVPLEALEAGVRVPRERLVEETPATPRAAAGGTWDERARQLRLAGGE
jgi:hypothetical protein